ncbi:hypothetical protein [Olleya sp. R77988]|uniref:hypothetical protein n=1 Tax=Olleya sp. R77988 TaxID=3093875 RepID=UPI0037C8AE01
MDGKPEWLKEHYEILDNNRLGFSPGMIDLAIDSYLNTQERKNYFTEILEKAKNIVNSKGDEIPVDELKGYDDKKNEELRYRVITPLKSNKIIQILDELIKMINEGESYNGEHHRPYFKFQDDENIL